MCKMCLMKTLSEYVADNGLKTRDLRDGLGVDHSTAWRLLSGAWQPGWKLAHKIAEFTKGEVPVSAWPKWRLP